MRIPSMIATVVVLIAAFVGISTLTAFGFTWGEVLWLILPVALTVAFVSWLIFRFGWRSAEWLNRHHQDDTLSEHEQHGPMPEQSGTISPSKDKAVTEPQVKPGQTGAHDD